MNRLLTTLFVVVMAAPAALRADEKPAKELKNDVVLRALVDELQRNKERLKLEGLESPYFIEFALTDAASASVSAKLGAVTGRNSNRNRSLRTELRVGSYRLDNTNFQGDYGSYFGGFGDYFGAGGGNIPIEDDYAAIRQAIWWSADRQFKSVTEAFERKKAFMESKTIEDKPDDFSREEPAVYFEERVKPAFDPADLEKIALPLSELFRKYPKIQSSSVSFNAAGGNKYLVNTEGTTIRISNTTFTLTASATVQAEEGMKFSDSITLYAKKLDDVPAIGELTDRAEKMIEQLLAVAEAPKLESYTGPVLFDAKAAAQVFSQQFAAKFCGGQRPVGGAAPPEDFEKKIGERILPKFMNIVDDPTRDEIDGQIVVGNYTYDDQGIKAQPVELVQKGKLTALLMSRNPSKKFKQSTGHGRGSYRPATSSGCLIVNVDEGEDDDALKSQLLDACKEEGLEYGLRVSAIGSGAGDRGRFSEMYAMFGGELPFGGQRAAGTMPLVMYKVFPDGREELVRAAEISRLEIKAFKKILAAGEKAYVLNSGSGSQGKTVAAPALLFEELDLAKVDRDFDKPPIIETPLARKGKDQALAKPVRDSNYVGVFVTWKVPDEVPTLVNTVVAKYVDFVDKIQKDTIRRTEEKLADELSRAKQSK